MKKLILLLLLLLPATSCDDASAPAQPGTLLVSLTSSANPGAVMLSISGPGIVSIQTANSSHQLFWRLVSDTEARAIVIGNLGTGPLISASVPDIGKSGDYTVTLQDVSNADGTQGVNANHTLAVTRAGGR